MLASSRCVINGRITPGTIVISPESGKITDVFTSLVPEINFPEASSYVDHSPRILMPGIVDAHVHLNEPGKSFSGSLQVYMLTLWQVAQNGRASTPAPKQPHLVV